MMWAMLAAVVALAAATLLPLGNHSHWLIRGLDFPRLQLAFAAAALVLVQLVWLDFTQVLSWALLLATLATLIWQVWWIIPYTPLWPAEVDKAQGVGPDRCLGILTANVLMPNRKAELLLAQVRQLQPDILVALESDAWWQSQLDVLEADMPYSLKCPLDNLYGMHVYSRLPLEQPAIEYLVEDDVPSMHALVRLRNGAGVEMHFLHPAPPSPTENPESAERDAELVIVARSVAESDLPVIVTGDLNDVAWSATTRLFRKLSGLLDPRVGRGMFNTFHAKYPMLRWPLDHLFHSRHFTLSRIQRLPPIGSDHFALFTELCFAPAPYADRTGLDASRSDRIRAREIAGEKDVEASDVPRPTDP
ncbi:MAG: endonuclease/exonuclease/phosphatase family protein [Pseudomonadales bacterium]